MGFIMIACFFLVAVGLIIFLIWAAGVRKRAARGETENAPISSDTPKPGREPGLD